jgi:hypothetical protein
MNYKFYICESKARFDSNVDISHCEIISIFDVNPFDKKAWMNLMKNKVRYSTDKELFIYYPEYYLNIVEQKELLTDLIKIHQRPFSILTDSPYIISRDELMEYVECI